MFPLHSQNSCIRPISNENGGGGISRIFPDVKGITEIHNQKLITYLTVKYAQSEFNFARVKDLEITFTISASPSITSNAIEMKDYNIFIASNLQIIIMVII